MNVMNNWMLTTTVIYTLYHRLSPQFRHDRRSRALCVGYFMVAMPCVSCQHTLRSTLVQNYPKQSQISFFTWACPGSREESDVPTSAYVRVNKIGLGFCHNSSHRACG